MSAIWCRQPCAHWKTELAGVKSKLKSRKKFRSRGYFTFMQQALSNLLLNAVVHTPVGTPMLLQARHENGQLVLNVADNGPGLPPELLPRIFDKFFRAPNAPPVAAVWDSPS